MYVCACVCVCVFVCLCVCFRMCGCENDKTCVNDAPSSPCASAAFIDSFSCHGYITGL